MALRSSPSPHSPECSKTAFCEKFGCRDFTEVRYSGMWLTLGPRQRVRGGEDVLREPLVEADLLYLQRVEILASQQ